MRSVAIVVPDLAMGGGVPVVAAFLYEAITRSGRYRADVVSIATSSRDDVSVRIASPATWGRGVRSRRGTWQGVPFEHVGARFVELEFQRYRPRAELTARLACYDVVQIVAGTPAWALAGKGCGRPLAVQVATLAAVERKPRIVAEPPLRRALMRAMTAVATRMESRALAAADVVFVENAWMRALLTERLGASRVVFAPPGVDTDLFHAGGAQAGREGPILSVGRMSDARKNVRLLFDAYARLRASVSSAPRLVLVGKGPTARDREHASRLGILEYVDVHEDVTTEALATHYRAASMFALSSDEEGLGLVLLEAMASGLPVVSTACGGPSTAVTEGETGFLVPVGEVAPLAERMARLHADRALRARMGTRARAECMERFSVAAAGLRFLDTYDRLLAHA